MLREYRHVPNSPRNNNLKSVIHIYSKKMVFLPLKILLYPLNTRINLFFSTLNVTISEMVKNECERFGGHVDMQVSYKILQLEVSKKAPSGLNAVLDSTRPQVFRD
jgi:hypothetical protein